MFQLGPDSVTLKDASRLSAPQCIDPTTRFSGYDITEIPGLHPEALQQTKQCKGPVSNREHADSLWAVVVAHASSSRHIALAHSTFSDHSQLVLAEKFFAHA